jgi:pSer/pThr/pTyr-binding forkhead associated (FHA) protein
MAKPLTTLYLHFSPDFPATIAGELIPLDSNQKGTGDSFFILGKVPYADIQFLPPEDKEIKKHFLAISRIHCTIRYDKKYKLWGILDGGVYLPEGDTSPGEDVVSPSKNGVYVNGQRITVNDWHSIHPGDRIHFGNDKKIVVYNSPSPTLDESIWEPENWVCRGSQEISTTPVHGAADLIKHTKENASPAPDNPWGLLGKVFDWLVAPGRTRTENTLKMLVLGFGIAVLTSDKVNFLINWIFNRE